MKEEDLKAYVDRLLRLREEERDELDEASLRDIASELGMDDEAWALVESRVAEHLTRGRSFTEHGLADEALQELGEAAQLAPGRLDVMGALAAAHGLRYEKQGERADRDEAERLARRCLDRDPGDEASYALLARLKTPRRSPLLPLAGLAILLVGPSLWLLSSTLFPPARPLPAATTAPPPSPAPVEAPRPPAPSPVSIEAPATPAPSRAPVELASPIAPSPVAVTTGKERDVPLRWVPGSAAGDLAFRARRSRVAYGYHRLHGEFRVQGQRFYEKLRLRIDLLDGGGKVLASDDFDALAGHQARRRPGDWIVFSHLLKAPEGVARAELKALLADTKPGAGPFPEAPLAAVSWRVPQPPGADLVFRCRKDEFSPTRFGGTAGYHRLTLEVENRGKTAVTQLKFGLTVRDAAGDVLVSKPMYGAISSEPSILPGERRLLFTISALKKPYGSHELAVVTFE